MKRRRGSREAVGGTLNSNETALRTPFYSMFYVREEETKTIHGMLHLILCPSTLLCVQASPNGVVQRS
jgi:hypothetical protein